MAAYIVNVDVHIEADSQEAAETAVRDVLDDITHDPDLYDIYMYEVIEVINPEDPTDEE
jgi:hypothetical protein